MLPPPERSAGLPLCVTARPQCPEVTDEQLRIGQGLTRKRFRITSNLGSQCEPMDLDFTGVAHSRGQPGYMLHQLTQRLCTITAWSQCSSADHRHGYCSPCRASNHQSISHGRCSKQPGKSCHQKASHICQNMRRGTYHSLSYLQHNKVFIRT